MTSGGPQQGWPGQPPSGQGPEGQQPPYGQPPAYEQQPQYGQPPAYGQQPQYGQPGQPASGQQPAYPGWQPSAPDSGWQQAAGQQYPPGQPYQQPQPYQQQPYQQPQADQSYPGYQQSAGGYPPQGYPAQQGQYGQQPGQYPPAGYGAPQGGGPTGQLPASGGKRKSNLPVIITVIAVVIALAAAGLIYWVAQKGSDTASGQSTPKDAVVNLLNSVTDEDPVGIADQLDPTEAHLFADMTGDVLSQLKRLGVVNKDVQADKVTGIAITTKDLTYADSPLTINDHLQIVELTGGTVTVQTGSGGVPYSDKITKVLPELKQVAQPRTETVDIAQQVKKLGHPFRIATVNRDGKWYPSLFYTVADNWAYTEHGADYKLTPIGNEGGSSPEDAMNKFLDAATTQDPKALISVLSPDEMGVLHDFGNMIIKADGDLGGGALGDAGLGDAQLSNVSWAVSDVTGGKKVSLKTLTVKTEQGDFSVERDPAAGSLKVSIPGQGTINVNADNIDTWLSQMMGPAAAQLPPQVREIIKREFPKVIGLGVVMVQGGDGKWYVSPLRTFSDVFVSLLSGLEAGDIDYFLSMADGGR